MSKAHAISAREIAAEVAEVAHDRRKTLTLLMDRYGDGIFRYALAMTRDRSLAEEVRQQVFVEAYRDVGNVADPAALPMWLFGIARHRCLDAVSSRIRWQQRYKNEPPDEPELDDLELDRELDRKTMARILADCLTKLAPAARDAVVLRYQQELSYDDAAKLAGELPGTLQRRVARALPVLRKCMESNLHGGER